MADAPDSRRPALLVVDVQNDFCTGGALAVPGSERVVAALNRYLEDAASRGIPIYASRDWHPAVTKHFQEYGGPWPVHCVQDSHGAQFRPDLALPAAAIIITKGDDAEDHGYSAFEGHTAGGVSFGDELTQHGITHLFVGGLATDYCVKHSVLGALDAGLTVTLLEDAISGVEVAPGDSLRAVDEMRRRDAAVEASDGSLRP